MSYKVPILFLIFNRPEATRLVFEALRMAKPQKLYIVADGPRSDSPADKELCSQVRRIVENIDWDCKVQRKYSDVNLGCKQGVSSGLDWFFENVEEGIILEDDCVPSQAFFRFMESMLNEYRDNDRIMHIGGNNFQNGRLRGDGSYYFSIFSHIWGWATWRRAWQLNDLAMDSFEKFKEEKKINRLWNERSTRRSLLRTFSRIRDNQVNSWAWPWMYSIWNNNGLCITPNYNLVDNIGFSPDATHTTKKKDYVKTISENNSTYIKHPSKVERDIEADRYTYNLVYRNSLLSKIINRLRRVKI